MSEFASPAWAPDASRLVYAAGQNFGGVLELFTSLPDGTGNVRVSSDAIPGRVVDINESVLWAPDASRIAYLLQRNTSGAIELHAASPTGGGAEMISAPLVPGGNLQPGFAWVPDASRVVYRADQDTVDVIELYSCRSDGSDNVRLNPLFALGQAVLAFAVAPDSSRVAYLANQDATTRTELYASAVGGGSNVRLSGTLAMGGNVSFGMRWAPDASRIAYVADQDTVTVTEVYTSRPDGSGNVKVSGPLPADARAGMSFSEELRGDWAPDASFVSYVVFPTGAPFPRPGLNALPDGSGSVEYTGVMDADGTGIQNWAQWSPDASRLVYVARQDAATTNELYVSSPDGSVNDKISGPLVPGGAVNTALFAWGP